MSQQLFQKIGKNILHFLKECGAGFYLLLVSTLISFILAILYYYNFIVTQNYGDIRVFIVMMMAIPAFALYFFRYTSRYASVAMYVMNLLAFAMFIQTSYMLLSTKFFNGIDPNLNLLEQASYEWSFTVIFMVVNLILSGIAIFMERKMAKRQMTEEKK